MSSPLEAQSSPETNAPLSAPLAPAPVPPAGPRRIRLGEWRLLALIVLLFLLRDTPWRLEEFSQAGQAFASLEMVRAGHWWFQHLPGGVLATTKPPLAGWVSALLYHLTLGNWDLAWRLPALLAALGLVLVLWRAGEKLWPHWGGTVAAGALALNFLTPRLAMLVSTDLPLTLETTLLGLVIWSRVRPGQPWSWGARRLVFWLLLAALMTAGPIVYAILLPGMFAHRWITRRQGVQAASDVWGGWWHWTLPLLPFLFWLERGVIKEPGFYQQIIGQPLPGHLAPVTTDAQQGQPFYFYLLQLLVQWAPWSVLLLGVRLRARRVWWQVCAEPGTLWLICWAAGGLLVLSLLPSPRLDRLFPVIPPFCLFLTAVLAAARLPAAEGAAVSPPVAERWPQDWSRWTLWVAGLLAVAGTVAQTGLVYRRHGNGAAEFGARVRALTEPARCELVLSKDPSPADAAMLVYLRRLSYLAPTQAIQLQSTGELDRIVVDDPSARGGRVLQSRFGVSHPLLVSGNSGRFVLLSSGEPAPAGPEPRR